MAKVAIPILGTASGMIAGIELYRSNNQNYARGAKLKRYKKKTSAQNEREQLFKQLVLAYSSFSSTLYEVLRPKRFYMSFANFFLSKNYKHYTYNSSLNNISASDVPSFRFFPFTRSLNLHVSEFEYVINTGFVASYLIDFDFDAYQVIGLAVHYRGRIFEELSVGIDTSTKEITLYASFPICKGNDAHIFLFIGPEVGDCIKVEYECYTNIAISPK